MKTKNAKTERTRGLFLWSKDGGKTWQKSSEKAIRRAVTKNGFLRIKAGEVVDCQGYLFKIAEAK